MARSVVILNADYTFLNTVSTKKALCLLAKGKTEVLKYGNEVFRTAAGMVFKAPAVMRLIKLIRTLYKARVPFSKKNVMVRDGFKCAYCGTDKTRLTIDHILPKAKGGKSSFENCVASCKPCNTRKGHKLCSEVKMYPRVKAHQPTVMEFLQLKMKALGINKVIEELFVK
jgi:5-methylcytosine-specific restriction endonuclease McrA